MVISDKNKKGYESPRKGRPMRKARHGVMRNCFGGIWLIERYGAYSPTDTHTDWVDYDPTENRGMLDSYRMIWGNMDFREKQELGEKIKSGIDNPDPVNPYKFKDRSPSPNERHTPSDSKKKKQLKKAVDEYCE